MALASKGKVSYAELQNVIVFYQFCISLFASFSTSSEHSKIQCKMLDFITTTDRNLISCSVLSVRYNYRLCLICIILEQNTLREKPSTTSHPSLSCSSEG